MANENATFKQFLGTVATGPLFLDLVQAKSLAIELSNFMIIEASKIRFPLITDDPEADWTAEGAEITESEAVANEVEVIPRKIAGLTSVSNEVANDSSPDALGTIADRLSHSSILKFDGAFFGPAPTSTAVQPGGLEYLGDKVTSITGAVDAGTDIYAEAISAAEQLGAGLRAFVTDPATALALAKLKVSTGSKVPLFGTGATNGIERAVLGVPLRVSPHVTPGTVWGIPDSNVHVVLREDVTVDFDRSVYFKSDKTAIRSIARIGFGFTHPKAIVKIKA